MKNGAIFARFCRKSIPESGIIGKRDVLYDKEIDVIDDCHSPSADGSGSG